MFLFSGLKKELILKLNKFPLSQESHFLLSIAHECVHKETYGVMCPAALLW